jgi:GNAT superfamily N-acetyltransferase
VIADPEIARVFESSWPAVEYADAGGFRVGRGQGGGGRVSSARALGPDWDSTAIAGIAAIQRGWGERPMFRVADGDDALQQTLTDEGFRHEGPTAVMAADCADLAARPRPGLSAFDIWPPLAIQAQIWAAGNISAGRQAAMQRVTLRRTALLGRVQDRAAGAAFVAMDGPVAMIHAIEVVPALRRQGVAGWLLGLAAQWAQVGGATRLALAVSRSNTGARALYDRIGFVEVGSYGYWSRD